MEDRYADDASSPLSQNIFYCMLEEKLLDHGEETECPDKECSYSFRCRALWRAIVEGADSLTPRDYGECQLAFDEYFQKAIRAHVSKVEPSTKNPFASRLAKLRWGRVSPEDRSEHGRELVSHRWGKRWVWD
jgi:hypothetical protein